MSSSPLPLECLQLIISHLTQQNDVQTLAKLLRVNRYVCSATLPFLYNNPFRRDFHNPPNRHGLSDSRLKLAQTLLRQVPPERSTPLLRMAVFEAPREGDSFFDSPREDDSAQASEPQAPYTPVIHYLPYLRKLGLDELAVISCTENNGSNILSAHLRRCLQTLNLLEHYRLTNVFVLISRTPSENKYIRNVNVDIKRQLLWALCCPAIIQDFTIPMSQLGWYMDAVYEFKSLVSVTFRVDKEFLCMSGNLSRMTDEGRAMVMDQEKEWAAVQEDMVRFVQKHVSHHKNVLMQAIFQDKKYRHACSNDVFFRMMQPLPPLINPLVLNSDNWMQFAAKSMETNLESVVSVSYPRESTQSPVEIDPFLHRCRSLRELDMSSTAGIFRWAVEEKDQYLVNKDFDPQPLVPLQKLSLSGMVQTLGCDVNDAVYAFSNSLKSLAVDATPHHIHGTDLPPFELGRDWVIPTLRGLTVHAFGHVLHIDPNMLLGCGALDNIDIGDGVVHYNPQEIRHWAPVELPSLFRLELQGTTALSFHPDTLHSTTRLSILSLGMGPVNVDEHFIPATEGELEQDDLDYINNGNSDGEQGTDSGTSSLRQPVHWSWDWHLPILTRLRLNAIFAYKFQFRMLQKCPSLEVISLNMSTPGDTHKRRITLSDLMLPGLDQGLNIEDSSRYISLPKLLILNMSGSWHFEENVLFDLFHKVAPNIDDLSECGCTGFDLEEWMRATDGLRLLGKAFSSLDVTTEQLLASGLETQSMADSRIELRYGLNAVYARYEISTMPSTRVPEAFFLFQQIAGRYVRPSSRTSIAQ